MRPQWLFEEMHMHLLKLLTKFSSEVIETRSELQRINDTVTKTNLRKNKDVVENEESQELLAPRKTLTNKKQSW